MPGKTPFTLLFAASVLPVSGCNGRDAVRPPNAQAVRTCADRWNQSNMVGWGPGPANAAFRRPTARERASIQLSKRRQCIVSIAAGRGTWTCVLAPTGAYWCPPKHEPTGPPLKRLSGANGLIDRRARLELDPPLKGTHPAPPLAWQRYPHLDGFIQPWTAGEMLRPGLRFTSHARGRCFLVGDTVRAGISCLEGVARNDACFPQRQDWRAGDLAACGGPGDIRFVRWKITGGAAPDPPVLVPWQRIGSIALGAPRARVIERYGAQPALGYRLHRGVVQVGYRRGRVDSIWLSTRFYRTKSGLGVGSRIPLGPCHRTRTDRCEHRWKGFVWNAWVREKPCRCWVKVGRGSRSLPATGDNFLKPWTFIDVRRGRVSAFYFASRFVD